MSRVSNEYRVEYRVEHVDVRGSRIHVKQAGAGAPVLLLHGNPDSAELWNGVVAGLQPMFHCIVPDLPGFGRSQALVDTDFSLEAGARFVDDLIDALGIREPVRVVVHDLGAFFGLSWAVRQPARVRHIAIVNTTYFRDYHWHLWAHIWRTPVLGELSMALMNRHLLAWALRRGSPGLSDAHIEQTYALFTPATRRLVLRLYRAMDPAQLTGWDTELLAVIARVPTIVLWGDLDPYIEASEAGRFGAAETHHFARCGHWLPAEAPDEVAGHLVRFFQSH